MPTTSQRAYKAVFFDLDGTLLPVDMDAFLQAYFKALGKYAAGHGQEHESSLPMRSTKACSP